jgi:hypothetical protein
MKYRKPRTLNWVTFMLVGMVGISVYLAVYLWPVYSSHSRVKGILLDHIPTLYKANLRPDDTMRAMIDEMKLSIAKDLKKAGINDKAVKLYIRRNPKEIELEARFKAYARFPWPDKTFEFNLSPRVVSDATRIDW